MPFQVISSINEPVYRHRTSEDMFGSNALRDTAWILDGATSCSYKRHAHQQFSDACWYVDNLSMRFHNQANGAPRDLEAMARDSIEEVRKAFFKAAQANNGSTSPEHNIPHHELPLAAGLLMAYNPEQHTLDFFGLGDCIAIVTRREGPAFVTTPTENSDEEASRIFVDDPQRTLEAYRDRRLLVNSGKEGGYWIFSVHPEALDHAAKESVALERNEPVHVLMMTDGMTRLIHPFERYTHDTLIKKVMQDGFEPVIKELRAIEKERFRDFTIRLAKQHDDAAGMLLHVTP